MRHEDQIEEIARVCVDCGYHLHKDLGPGLLESAYELVFAKVLEQRGFTVQRQIALPISYQGVVVDNAFKVDLLINGCLVVELKSTERLAAVHAKQLLTYLRLMDLPLGLLMNFGQATFKAGLQRVVNDYQGDFRKR